jgi:hypothetical protein
MKTLLLRQNPTLGGTLPSSWAAAAIGSSLQALDLRATALTGSISSLWTGAQMPSLTCFAAAPGMCGIIPEGLPCFSIVGSHLGGSTAHQPALPAAA